MRGLVNRTMIIRLISTARTGYFYTTARLRQSPAIKQVKYDPVGASFVVSGGFDTCSRQWIVQ